MNNVDIAQEVSKHIFKGKTTVDQPVVYLLMGLQYSGKSYIANQIASKNFAHFWATKIKKQFSIENPDMYKVALFVMHEAVTAGYNIVLDFVNHKYTTRKEMQSAALKLGAEYKLIFLDTPKEERLRRREENIRQGESAGRRIISLGQMEAFEDEFEAPRADEPTIRLQTQQDIEAFIEKL